MPRIYHALCAIVFTLGLVLSSDAASIKTMSFNVRYDPSLGTPSPTINSWVSTNRANRRDLAVQVVQDQQPDILGVQEALPHQVADLAAGLPDYDHYGVGRDNGSTQGEQSTIYYRRDRFTRIDQGTFWLSHTPTVPSFFPGAATRRIASWSVLRDHQSADRDLLVLNTHWDHISAAARAHSAGLIRQQLAVLAPGLPVMAMGDLNLTEDDATYLDMIGTNAPNGLQLRDSFREVFPTRTRAEKTSHGFQAGLGGSRIDFIFHNDDFLATDAQIVRTHYGGAYPSDHYPVTAELHYVPEPTAGLIASLALLCFSGLSCRHGNFG